MPLREGDSFAGFTVVRLLGSGDMGEVYAVQHPRLPRLEALRILPAAPSADPGFRARFQREADLAASLHHPHIVGLHDRGESGGRLWILTGYVQGINAAQLLNDHPHGLAPGEVLQIIGAIAQALDAAHQHGLLHHNVKPANIMLTNPRTAHQRILLADLGLPRRTGAINATTAPNLVYTAPELLRGIPFEDQAADQYSLAATAYHLLTGAAPFGDSNRVAVTSGHLSDAPASLADTRPQLASMDTALTRALAKDPAARFKRCQDFADALGYATPAGRAPAAPPAATTPPPPSPTAGQQIPFPGPWPTVAPPSAAGRLPPGPWPPPGTPAPYWLAPPPRRGRRRWALGAVATVVAVAATLAGVALISARTGSRPAVPSGATSSGPPPPVAASVGDTGPVGVITADPTCSEWKTVSETWFGSPLENWTDTHPGQPDPVVTPGNAWTPEQRAAATSSAGPMRLAVSRTISLAKATPHRVTRQLYEQFVAYGRAFADMLNDNYLPSGVNLGAVAEASSNALVSICHVVANGAAATRSALANPTDAPQHPAPPQDPARPQRFATASDFATCGALASVIHIYTDNPTVKDWVASDHGVAVSAWSPQQKALNDAVMPLMLNLADDLQRTLAHSNNPVMQDIGALASLYQRIFAKALPSYTPADYEINGVALYSRNALDDACAAIGS